MLDRKPDPARGATHIGAYEAKTKFSELIARAEKGESFVVTKNGRPVARLGPIDDDARIAAAQAAGERLLARMDASGLVSAAEAQRNWDELRRHLDDDDDAWDDKWLSSSTPR